MATCPDICETVVVNKLKNCIGQAPKIFYVNCKDRPRWCSGCTEIQNLQKKLNKLINRTQVSYYTNLFDINKDSPKKTWQLIKKSLNNDDKNDVDKLDIIRNEIGDDVSNESDIGNMFNIFFSEIGDKLAGKINIPFKTSLPTSPLASNTLYMMLITEQVSVIIFSTLIKDSSSGNDGISVENLKLYHSSLLKPLPYLINRCFLMGNFPNVLKKIYYHSPDIGS